MYVNGMVLIEKQVNLLHQHLILYSMSLQLHPHCESRWYSTLQETNYTITQLVDKIEHLEVGGDVSERISLNMDCSNNYTRPATA